MVLCADLEARLVYSVGLGWYWCYPYSFVDEEDAEAGKKSEECFAIMRRIRVSYKRESPENVKLSVSISYLPNYLFGF
jgi:hypothetical protein